MTDPTIFGQMLDGADVEAAVLEHLRNWLPTYKAEVVRQKDPDNAIWPQGIPEVADYTVRHAAAEKWPEDRLPMLLAYCPGINGVPERAGDGTYTAPYVVVLSAIASGIDQADTKALARVYGTAAMGALLQHPDLGGFAEGTRWVDEQTFRITRGVEAERSLMAVADTYIVTVGGLLDDSGGPREPLDDPSIPPGPWPVVGEGEATGTVEIRHP